MKKGKKGVLSFGVLLCFSIMFPVAGCSGYYGDIGKDKLVTAEWDASINSIYQSLSETVRGDIKITIKTEKEVVTGEYHDDWENEVTAVSCGDKEYYREKKTERRALSNGETVSERVTETEKYLERTQDGIFEYNFENGKWIRKKTEYESVIAERVTEYNELYSGFFEVLYSEIRYDRKEKGYVNNFVLWGDSLEYASCIYRIKDKRIASISANRVCDKSFCNASNETVYYFYDYGRQEVKLPDLIN